MKDQEQARLWGFLSYQVKQLWGSKSYMGEERYKVEEKDLQVVKRPKHINIHTPNAEFLHEEMKFPWTQIIKFLRPAWPYYWSLCFEHREKLWDWEKKETLLFSKCYIQFILCWTFVSFNPWDRFVHSSIQLLLWAYSCVTTVYWESTISSDITSVTSCP